jgi:hypothetical protein
LSTSTLPIVVSPTLTLALPVVPDADVPLAAGVAAALVGVVADVVVADALAFVGTGVDVLDEPYELPPPPMQAALASINTSAPATSATRVSFTILVFHLSLARMGTEQDTPWRTRRMCRAAPPYSESSRWLSVRRVFVH